MSEPIFLKVGMFIMAPEPTPKFTLSLVLLNFFVFYAAHAVSKESRRLVLLLFIATSRVDLEPNKTPIQF
jgi:hypothetical protein